MSVTKTAAANADLINGFFEAFRKRDAEGMAASYAPGIRFSDPVFGRLEGERARAMWRMLNQPGGGGLELTFQLGEVDDATGTAAWRAKYKAPTRAALSRITSRPGSGSLMD